MLAGFALALGLLLLRWSCGTWRSVCRRCSSPCRAHRCSRCQCRRLASGHRHTPPPSFCRDGSQWRSPRRPAVRMLRHVPECGRLDPVLRAPLRALITPFEFPDNANFYYARLRSPCSPLCQRMACWYPSVLSGSPWGSSSRGTRRRLRRCCGVAGAVCSAHGQRCRCPATVRSPCSGFPFAGFALTRSRHASSSDAGDDQQRRRWPRRSRSISLWLEPHLGVDAGQLTNSAVRSPSSNWRRAHTPKPHRPQDARARMAATRRTDTGPIDAAARVEAGVPLQLASGDSAGARTTLAEIVAAARRNANCCSGPGDVHRQQLGDAANSRRTLRRALALHPPRRDRSHSVHASPTSVAPPRRDRPRAPSAERQPVRSTCRDAERCGCAGRYACGYCAAITRPGIHPRTSRYGDDDEHARSHGPATYDPPRAAWKYPRVLGYLLASTLHWHET